MGYCPNKKDDKYKEMKDMLGDELTHYVWNENNGNPIDKTKEGKESKLFNDLLKSEYVNNNRDKAILLKSKIYSNNFKKWFGEKITESNYRNIDENGEPILFNDKYFLNDKGELKNIKTDKIISTNSNKDNFSFLDKENNGKEVVEKMILNTVKEGRKIFLKDILKNIDDKLLIEKTNKQLVGTTNNKFILASGLFVPDKNKILIKNDQHDNSLLHELVHSVLYYKIKDSKEFLDYFNKVKSKLKENGITEKEYYGLNNPQEFMAELFSNSNFMKMLSNHEAIENKEHRNIAKELISLFAKWLGIKNDNLLYESIEKGYKLLNENLKEKLVNEQKDNYYNDNSINNSIEDNPITNKLKDKYKIGKTYEDKVFYQKSNDSKTKDTITSSINKPNNKVAKDALIDLSMKLSDKIGIPVEFLDNNLQFKGRLKKGIAYINLKNATLDTPIHEIIGHPLISVLRTDNVKLYDNLTKELKYGTGKETLDRIKESYPEYNEDTQIEEATVELLGLYTANKLNKIKDKGIISVLRDVLKHIKNTVLNLLHAKSIKINELPESLTIDDLSMIVSLSDGKLLLPGYEVEHTTQDGETFKTYEAAEKHVFDTNKQNSSKNINEIKPTDIEDFKPIDNIDNIEVDNFTAYPLGQKMEVKNENGTWVMINEKGEKVKVNNKLLLRYYNEYYLLNKKENGVSKFIFKNTKFEKSKFAIDEWIKVNNIKYDPEEVYSRGMMFYHKVGAYVVNGLSPELLLQNYLAILQDYSETKNAEFVINTIFRKPNERSYFETNDSDLRIKIVPNSKDIKWAAKFDTNSGSTTIAGEPVGELFSDKHPSILGLGASKSPLNTLLGTTLSPNLADIIDNKDKNDIGDDENYPEIGIQLNNGNFRFEYDHKVPYNIKKLADRINKLLDIKYGKLKEPKLNDAAIKPKITNSNIKKSINEINDEIGNIIFKEQAATNINIAQKREYQHNMSRGLIETKVVKSDDNVKIAENKTKYQKVFNKDEYEEKKRDILSRVEELYHSKIEIRPIMHFDTPENWKDIHEKVIKINTTYDDAYAYMDKVIGKGKGRSPKEYLVLRVVPLNDLEMAYKEAGQLTMDKKHNLRPKVYIVNDKKLNDLYMKRDEVNKYRIRNKFIITKTDGGAYRFKYVENPKFIDDLVGLIENYSDKIKIKNIPDDILNGVDYQRMVQQIGIDAAKKITSLNNNEPLNENELNEYKNKLSNYTPSDNYDKMFDEYKKENENPNYDFNDEDYDKAIDYDQDKNIHDFIDDMINNNVIPVENIDEDSDKNKDIKSEAYDDFINKIAARRDIYYNRLNKTSNKELKNETRLNIIYLNDLIKDTKRDFNVWSILSLIENDIKKLNIDLENSNLNSSDLKYYSDVLDLWDISINDYRKNNDSPFSQYLSKNIAFRQSIVKYNGIIIELKNKLLGLYKQESKKTLNVLMNKEIKDSDFNRINEISRAKMEFFDSSRTGNLVIDGIYKLLNSAENIKTKRSNDFIEEFDNVVKELKSKGFDISKKDVRERLLEKHNGNFTSNLIARHNAEFSIQIDKLNRLYVKINKNNKFSKKYNYDAIKLSKEILSYIDINKLVDNNRMLDDKKLDVLYKQLTDKYDSDYAEEIITKLKDNENKFLQDSESVKNWFRDRVKIEKEFEYIRKEYVGDTKESIEYRIENEINTLYSKWYAINNPFDFFGKRDNSALLRGKGHEYLVFIPKDKYLNDDFKQLQQDKPLYEFYKYYKRQLNKYIYYLPENVRGRLLSNFLPKLQKTLLENFNGLNNIVKKVSQSQQESLMVSYNSSVKKLNMMGNEVSSIPIRYINDSTIEIEGKINHYKELLKNNKIPNKDGIREHIKFLEIQKKEIKNRYSTDISMILKQFSIMAENYRVYNKIEDDINIAKDAVDNIKSVKLIGNSKQQNVGDYKTVNEGAKNVIENLKYSIDSLMYQNKKNHLQILNRVYFKSEDLNNEYKSLLEKIKENKSAYMNMKKSYVQYIFKEQYLQSKIEELYKYETPRIISAETVVDKITHLAGTVGIGFNIKSAINNYAYGKVSLFAHAMGEEDYDINELKSAYKVMNKAMRFGINSPISKKVEKLSKKYNVVFEMNEAAYGVKSSLAEKTEKFYMFKNFGMMKYGEYYLQNVSMIALMMHDKIEVKDKTTGKEYKISLWDAYNTNGDFRSDLLYLNNKTTNKKTESNFSDSPEEYNDNIDVKESNKYLKLTQKIEQLNKLIHGNYDPRSPIKIKSGLVGRMTMMYKSWVPEGIALRFEKEIWDDMLGRYRKGKYRTAYEVGLMKSFGMLAKSFFNKKNINREDFVKSIDYSNMLKNLQELRYMTYIGLGQLSLHLMLATLRGGGGVDTEDEKRFLRTLINQLSRLSNDTYFYMSPSSMINMVKNPAPAIQYLYKWFSWLQKARKFYSPAYYSEKYTVGKWLGNGISQVPIANEIKKWVRESKKLNQ